ncbi:hypothetical protein RRF57_008657 [Xylaria bambusicola]|uniref:Uncharacterized protein n=1 Tax=Xylaria bambusicola TaxID=326684 RepID=A0AAN7V1Y1_9PEZI
MFLLNKILMLFSKLVEVFQILFSKYRQQLEVDGVTLGKRLDTRYIKQILEVVLRWREKGSLQGTQSYLLGVLRLDFGILKCPQRFKDILVGGTIVLLVLGT